MRRPSHGLSRRSFLGSLAAGGAGLMLPRRVRASDPPALFEEVPASASGITFVHDNARSAERYLPETLGPGCAFFDYDNDGWMDVYIVNSGPCDFFKPRTPLRNALYRNNRDGTFTDVTEKAGVPGGTFGMGVAVGDYDNDGYPDLFVTAYGRCLLYHNNGDGTFTDVTDKAGVAAPGWTTSAVWFDYDNDGRLDLFVCSFVEFGLGKKIFCGDNKLGRKYYCIPRVFKPTPSLLFHNNGDGTFTEASKGSDIARSLGKALGVVATDIHNDGLLDLFVANDTVQNFLFANRGGGKWEEIGLPAEVGYSANGQARSGMGVDAVDLDGDGLQAALLLNRLGNPDGAFERLRAFALAGDDTPAVIEAFGLATLRMPSLPGEVPVEKREMVLLAGRGGFHLARGRRTAVGRMALEELAFRYPQQPNVHYALGSYLASDQPDPAIQEFRRELLRDPGHFQAMVQIASLELVKGNAEAAAVEAEKAVAAAPNVPAARLVLGRALLDSGRIERAVQELEQGRKLAPESAMIRFSLARAYQRAGRTEEAAREREEFRRLNEAAPAAGQGEAARDAGPPAAPPR